MDIKAIFSDIGGVCLSNGWEHPSRSKAAEHFSLDLPELEKRHHAIFNEFERGEMSLQEYLEGTVFYQSRSFTSEDFIQFMYGETKPYKENLDILKGLHEAGQYLMGAINNESRELNDFRITTFGLDQCFSFFFSSCFVGLRKPDPKIYQMALDVTRQRPQECLFIDDRRENVQAAQALHMRTIHLENPGDLSKALSELNITATVE